MAKQKRIVLGVTGSVAAYKAGDIIRRLSEQGIFVDVVMTKEAEAFITPLTLGSLSGRKVFRGAISDESASWEMPHIQLARDVDAVDIAPATANIIGKMANGLADDLLTALVLAVTAPVVIAPAMNTEMYKNAFVQENCARLKKHGFHFIAPVKGKLACGDIGDGHLADVDVIVSSVLRLVK